MNPVQPARNLPMRLSRNIRTTGIPILLLALAFLTPDAHSQTFTVIHSFANEGDGAAPVVGVTLDRAGSLYGTAYIAFKMKNSGSGWTLTPLYAMDTTGGALSFGPNGTLYGTTPQGGLSESGCEFGCGTVFNLQPRPSICGSLLCPWNNRNLYLFMGQSDLYQPQSPLAFDSAGNIYGTAINNVFELVRSGNSYTFTTVYDFSNGGGQYPMSGVVIDSAGNLYGTTSWGGANNLGAVYKITPNGSGWTESVIYSFRGQEDGQYVPGGLVFDQAGNLYGSTAEGGSGNGGTIFELSPSGSGWTYSLLYSLTKPQGGTTAPGPSAALAIDAAGNLYGTTTSDGAHANGSAFKLTHGQNGWDFTDLHDFTGGDDGSMLNSQVTPAIDANGTNYGTAPTGGTDGFGVVWEIAGVGAPLRN